VTTLLASNGTALPTRRYARCSTCRFKRQIWLAADNRVASSHYFDASMARVYQALATVQSDDMQRAVTHRWKPFCKATQNRPPQAAILFDDQRKPVQT